jgi:hypothetical protein
MSAPDVEIAGLVDGQEARRIGDISCVLTVLVGNAARHDRDRIERLAEEIFELVLRCLLPDEAGKP